MGALLGPGQAAASEATFTPLPGEQRAYTGDHLQPTQK
jgi:hypothetical protein